ncbi:nitrite reductase small subunit NirD [Nitrincola sp. A-D6]|uniref:nitrite reductase small subunit NirD n=1 Tax=Nitrincola sp. A-D6 TaxID=1545442 RepID=UPI0009DCFCE7|nr:nitrite reductase small subunit NirD [Nitrincola sp. A-D6]
MNSAMSIDSEWMPVCHLDDLVAGAGVAVIINGQPVAIFWLPGQQIECYALSHTDPFSGADVLAHGILCEIEGAWSVASPLYKQHFRLDNGVCLEDPQVSVACWPVRLHAGQVEIAGFTSQD